MKCGKELPIHSQTPKYPQNLEMDKSYKKTNKKKTTHRVPEQIWLRATDIF